MRHGGAASAASRASDQVGDAAETPVAEQVGCATDVCRVPTRRCQPGDVHWGKALSRLAAAGAALLVLWVVVFLWVWLGMWSLPPDRYADAATWWRAFVLPRAARALVVAVPLAALIGWLTNHTLSSRWRE